MKGGTIVHKSHNDKIVRAVFRGEEKRLVLIQARGPVVLKVEEGLDELLQDISFVLRA